MHTIAGDNGGITDSCFGAFPTQKKARVDECDWTEEENGNNSGQKWFASTRGLKPVWKLAQAVGRVRRLDNSITTVKAQAQAPAATAAPAPAPAAAPAPAPAAAPAAAAAAATAAEGGGAAAAEGGGAAAAEGGGPDAVKSGVVFSVSKKWLNTDHPVLHTSLDSDGALNVTVQDHSNVSLGWNKILKETLQASRANPLWDGFYREIKKSVGKTDSLEKDICKVMYAMDKANTLPQGGPFMPVANALKDNGYSATDISRFFNPGKDNGECAAVVVKSADRKEVLICMLVKAIGCPKWKVVTIARDQGKQKDLAHFKQCLGDPLDPMKSKRHAQLCTEQDENNIALGRGQGIFPDTAKATDEKLAMIAELEAIVVRLKTATGSKASVATTPSPTAAGSVSMLEIMDEPGKKGLINSTTSTPVAGKGKIKTKTPKLKTPEASAAMPPKSTAAAAVLDFDSTGSWSAKHDGNVDFFAFLAENKINDTVSATLKDEEIEDFHTLAHFTKFEFADIGIKAGPALKLLKLCKAQEGI